MFKRELYKKEKSFKELQIEDIDINFCHICNTYTCVSHSIEETNIYSLQRLRKPFFFTKIQERDLKEL